MRDIFYVLSFHEKAESKRGKNKIYVVNNQLVHYLTTLLLKAV